MRRESRLCIHALAFCVLEQTQTGLSDRPGLGLRCNAVQGRFLVANFWELRNGLSESPTAAAKVRQSAVVIAFTLAH
jgi:hypothetical protein